MSTKEIEFKYELQRVAVIRRDGASDGERLMVAYEVTPETQVAADAISTTRRIGLPVSALSIDEVANMVATPFIPYVEKASGEPSPGPETAHLRIHSGQAEMEFVSTDNVDAVGSTLLREPLDASEETQRLFRMIYNKLEKKV